MFTAVLCYAPEDEIVARSLAEFVEKDLSVNVEAGECVVRSGFDLFDALERATAADVAVALISPAVMPLRWERARWEPVFNEQVACLLLRDCGFPKVLRRARFFEGRDALKDWLRLEAVTRAPVVATGVPADQVETLGAGFEKIYRIDCHCRTRAGLAGELKRSGIREDERALLVLDGYPEEHRNLVLYPQASVIYTEGTISTRAPVGWDLLDRLDPEFPEEALELLEKMAQCADAEELRRIERRKAWLTGDALPSAPTIGEQLCLSL